MTHAPPPGPPPGPTPPPPPSAAPLAAAPADPGVAAGALGESPPPLPPRIWARSTDRPTAELGHEALTPLPPWAKLELFRGVRRSAVEALQSASTPFVCDAGAALVREGQTGGEMFLVNEGVVRVAVRGEKANTYFERTMAAPALIGEMSLFTNEPRTASVWAETRVSGVRVSRPAVDELLERAPQAATILTRIVGERLMEAGAIRRVGKYEVQGRIGAGAVATVFSAVHPQLGKEVALKMLSHALVNHPGFADQFRAEARVVASLSHEHIVRVLDTEEAYGTHFIVMERLNGLMLEELIEKEQPLAWGAVRRILKEVALALAYSHERGLLHRDVKPSNVFLTEDRRAKLLDFGIAVHVEASATRSGHLLGTPYYMSPEQIRGEQLDGRTDLYALGIMAYELCTRYVPYDGDSLDELLEQHLRGDMPDPRELMPDIPDDLVQFIRVATAKRAADRFPSCAAAARFLQTAAELPMVHKLELTTLAISYHPSRRRLVAEALNDLHNRLVNVAGVSLLHGHQGSHQVDE